MRLNRAHSETPGAPRLRSKSTGITQYTSRCGITVYSVQPNERLVTCAKCLQAIRIRKFKEAK